MTTTIIIEVEDSKATHIFNSLRMMNGVHRIKVEREMDEGL